MGRMTDQINPTAREWLIVKEWAEKRLADYRSRLENFAMGDEITTYNRGRIAELKALIALGEPKTQPTQEPQPDE